METRPWHASYDPGVPREIEPEGLTLHAVLARTASRFPDSSAIRFVNRTTTYAELQTQVTRFASALVEMGLTKGDRVAIHLPNLPQTIVAFYGTLAAGGVVVFTNPMYVAREIEAQWRDAGCTFAVTADFLYRGSLEGIRERLPVKQWIIASIPEALGFPLNVLAPMKLRRQSPPAIAHVPPAPNVHRFPAMLSRAATANLPTVLPSDLAALQYTGGTTGVAKGAMLTHANLAANAQQNAAWLPVADEGREVFMGALPFFHAFGLTVAMNFPIRIGAKIVVIPNPRDVRGLVHAITHERITIFPIVPAIVRAISSFPRIDSIDISSIRVCVSGSAPLPEPVLRRFEEMTGGKIIEGFGLTEASPVTHCNPVFGERVVSSIGLPFSSTDCRIVDDAKADVPPGTEGELLIRGPQVMQGYWNQPQETQAALRDGWLHTGDLATMDARGYFRIVGRKKEMIVAGGYKIYPDEVDRVLAEHPAVAESATIGVPDERRGETVKSFVVLHPGMRAEPSDLAAHCHERLAPYKVPKQIELRRELPKSSALKVLRRELLQEELAKRNS